MADTPMPETPRLTDPSPGLWPTAHQAILAGQSPALPGPGPDANPEPTEPTYGMCTGCRSIEVALVEVIGTRDFSNIGESASYPIGYGCEVCS